MQQNEEKNIKRPVQRVPETAQMALFTPESEPVREEGPKGTAEFVNPDPGKIFIGETGLGEYVSKCGFEWVIRLRELVMRTDLSGFEAAYEPSGRKPIHPGVMIGLLVYGIVSRKSSLRDMEGMAKMDVGAWWICGGLQPDHSTIGKFITRHMEHLTEQYFVELTRMLVKELRIGVGEVAGDGTVIEAAASRYRTIKAEAAKQAAEEARKVADGSPEDKSVGEAAERAEVVAEAAEERLRKRLSAGKKAEGACVNTLEPEAVIQPQKNGTSRPSYKPSVLADSNKLIIGKHVDPSDETCAIEPMLRQHVAIHNALPSRMMLDAGYHNGTVLGMSVAMGVDLLCPGGKADAGKWQREGGKYGKTRFKYNEERDCYRCPEGKELEAYGKEVDRSGRGYTKYRSASCKGCSARALCTKGQVRIIKRYECDEYKEAMREILKDQRARTAYRMRKAYVEPVFGDLREKQGLKRFRRRGLSGARVEFSLHCIAYNLKRAISIQIALFFVVTGDDSRIIAVRWSIQPLWGHFSV